MTRRYNRKLWEKIDVARESAILSHIYYKPSTKREYATPGNRQRALRRNTQRRLATPKWANKKYINLFYKIAKLESSRLNKEVNVDHIIPIFNDKVCGLHNEFNLQLLFREDNIKKSNKFEI